MFFVLVRNIDNAMQCKKLCKIARALYKFNGDFKICNTEDDGCTVETCLENQEIKESCYVYTNFILLIIGQCLQHFQRKYRDQLLSSVLFIVYRSQTISLPHLLRNLTIYLGETRQFVPDRLFSYRAFLSKTSRNIFQQIRIASTSFLRFRGSQVFFCYLKS